MTVPFFTNDAIVFGILMLSLGFVFYTESLKSGFWPKFYKIVPGLFMAYFIPAIFTTIGLISPEWETTNSRQRSSASSAQPEAPPPASDCTSAGKIHVRTASSSAALAVT